MSAALQPSIFIEQPNPVYPVENKITVLPKLQKQIPVKVIFSDESEQSSTTEDKTSTKKENNLKEIEKVVYPFFIVKSRKKDKKILRKKYNTVISRVHNMDCLLKKIKA